MPTDSVDISVHVGNQFTGDSLPNIVSWYTDFSLYQNGSRKQIDGELGRDPAGYFIPQKKGTYAIGYQSDVSYIEIKADIFNHYLKQEGLDNAIHYREQHGLLDTTGKETYIRYAKTLVQSGESFTDDNSTTNFGYTLEIIPTENPYQKKILDRFSVKILYHNKPVENILLTAFSKTAPQDIQQVRSDQYGNTEITLNHKGPWLLKAVKIIPAHNKKENWQSHWASLTFSIN